MQKPIPLNKIKPNPFRHLERYQIKREKIDALRESFRKTGYWGNVVGREMNGFVELAYGHHRWVAFKEENKGKSQVKMELIIKKLSNADMLRVMADENMNEWSHSAEVQQETIRAVVQAYAEGELDGVMPKPPKDTPKKNIRNAPSFGVGDLPETSRERPYTAETLAEFLSGGKKKEACLQSVSSWSSWPSSAGVCWPVGCGEFTDF